MKPVNIRMEEHPHAQSHTHCSTGPAAGGSGGSSQPEHTGQSNFMVLRFPAASMPRFAELSSQPEVAFRGVLQ